VSAPAELTEANKRLNAWFAYVGSAVSLTGVQMIAPSLPAMRDALGLSEVQLGLVTSVYLLPAALAAIPAGILADRVGRRRVFGGAMLGFGICGAILPFVSGSFAAFLVVRFIQGTFFAGLLPLTMTILGDAFTGTALIGAQGRRSVAMSFGDGALPVVGGLLVGFGWYAPWFGQMLGIVLGVLILLKLIDPPDLQSSERVKTGPGALIAVFRSLPVLAMQYSGFLRMFLKFCILAFMPLLLVDVRGLSPAFAGLIIGSAALTGTLIAATSGRIARVFRPAGWVGLGTTVMGFALVSMATMTSAPLILASSIVYGAAEGLMGVFTNSFVTAATGAEQRASFVAATGAIRNFAKFMAPAAFGALVLVVPIQRAFVLAGALTLVSASLAFPLRHLEGKLANRRQGATP
jgi:MFS transporter, ACDE family, multidrug resistance protein